MTPGQGYPASTLQCSWWSSWGSGLGAAGHVGLFGPGLTPLSLGSHPWRVWLRVPPSHSASPRAAPHCRLRPGVNKWVKLNTPGLRVAKNNILLAAVPGHPLPQHPLPAAPRPPGPAGSSPSVSLSRESREPGHPAGSPGSQAAAEGQDIWQGWEMLGTMAGAVQASPGAEAGAVQPSAHSLWLPRKGGGGAGHAGGQPGSARDTEHPDKVPWPPSETPAHPSMVRQELGLCTPSAEGFWEGAPSCLAPTPGDGVRNGKRPLPPPPRAIKVVPEAGETHCLTESAGNPLCSCSPMGSAEQHPER